MCDHSVRSRSSFARATVNVLAIVVLLFAGSVQAQDSPRIGVKVRTLTVELRKQHKLPEDAKGALVTAVTAGSPAQATDQWLTLFAAYFLSRASRHFPPLRYLYVPQLALAALAFFLPALRLPRFLAAFFFAPFFFVFAD